MVPFGDWILVEREEPAKLSGGIELPDSADPTHAVGRVVAFGKKLMFDPDVPEDVLAEARDLKEGDRIVFEFYAAVKIDDPGIEEKGMFIKPNNIIAKL